MLSQTVVDRSGRASLGKLSFECFAPEMPTVAGEAKHCCPAGRLAQAQAALGVDSAREQCRAPRQKDRAERRLGIAKGRVGEREFYERAACELVSLKRCC